MSVIGLSHGGDYLHGIEQKGHEQLSRPDSYWRTDPEAVQDKNEDDGRDYDSSQRNGYQIGKEEVFRECTEIYVCNRACCYLAGY